MLGVKLKLPDRFRSNINSLPHQHIPGGLFKTRTRKGGPGSLSLCTVALLALCRAQKYAKAGRSSADHKPEHP